MKNLLLSVGFSAFATISLYAQINEKEQNTENVYTIVEVQPEYPGGMEAMYKFIRDNVRYPKDALKANIQGKAYIKFMVDSKGTVRDAVIIRGVSESIDAEALRVVNAMPTWKPGTQSGRAVNVYYNLPIEFKLK